MTDAQLAKRVEYWRKRIIPEWRVVLLSKCPADEDGDDSGGMGRCIVQTKLRTIQVWINRDEHKSNAATEETIVHELLHALVQPVEDVFDSVRASLSVDAGLQLNSRLDAETEPLVERLSRAMVGAPDETAWK